MLWDTIKLITGVVERYGSEENLVLIGEQTGNFVIDFVKGAESDLVTRHRLELQVSPLDHIRKNAPIVNYGDDGQSILALLPANGRYNGPVILDSVLEREPDPFEVMRVLAQQLSHDGYIILVGAMSSPHFDSTDDRWRFTPVGLQQLLSNANLFVLESGWRLRLHGPSAIQSSESSYPEQLFTCYAVAARRELPSRKGTSFILPALNSEKPRNSAEEQPVALRLQQEKRAHRCVFLNTCYEAFLRHHYTSRPELLSASYQEQLDALNQTFFGDSDFYSRGLQLCGFEATDLVVNCAPLQRAWATEHGISAAGHELVKRQLDELNPDVVYVQDMAGTPRELLSYARTNGALIVGQIACELAQSVPLDSYDIVFSSFPHFVDTFRQAGITSYYQPLAFEPRILDAIGNIPFDSRDIECSFIGGLSSFHQAGSQLLEKLAAETPIQMWGYGVEQIPSHSAIARRHRGEAWGRTMFSLFNRSKITVNRHSEAAGTNANNMRLFEATGAGALLITDYKDNLNQIFEIGTEVVAYRSPEECAALIRYYQTHPAQAKKIAEAGQRRTLRDHSYQSRMNKTAEILARHIEYRKLHMTVPDLQAISSNFKPLLDGPTKPELTESWKNPEIALSQRGLVQRELAAMYRGDTPMPFLVASRLLSPAVRRGSTVLEVGCSSGYYYEALEYLLKRPISYTGCDYSEAMIHMAHQFYPKAAFHVSDGAALPFVDRTFEIVISGCILLHCPNYSEHIKESCRVARKYILLHRTPISLSGQTRFFEKLAYGVPTVEIWFSEQEILGLFSKYGFELVARDQYGTDAAREVFNVSYLLKSGGLE